MDLYEAFGLAPGAIVAAVGGGGKTSLLFALAGEAAARGLSAVVTTTVRFTMPEGCEAPVAVEAPGEEIVAALRGHIRPGTVTIATSGGAAEGRMGGFAPKVVDAIAALGAGLVAVEADGSAQRHFKAPADHEPVIPGSATHVVVCAGLDVLGAPLGPETVHRPGLVGALAGLAVGEPLTPRALAAVMLHPGGGRKGVDPGMRLCALLNNPPGRAEEEGGREIGALLVAGGYDVAVIAAVQTPGDIRAVVRRPAG